MKTNKPAITVDGRDVVLTRRRYGTKTFCWVSVHVANGTEKLSSGREMIFPIYEDCGDPFPCVTPKRSEIDRVVREQIERYERKGAA